MKGSRRTVLAVVALVVAFGAILVLSRPRQDPFTRPPLDPRGTGPTGLAALSALLRQQGVDLRLGGLPSTDDDLVLQVRDTFSGEPAERLRRWVRDGGTLVVTDPRADLAPDTVDDFLLPRLGIGPCDLDALDDLGNLGVAVTPVYELAPDHSACAASTAGSWIDVGALGEGTVVALGSPDPFLNRHLGAGSDAELAVTLLRPRPGVTVRVLDPTRFVGDEGEVGDGTVLGAMPVRGRQALLEIVVAFLVWGLARGRRLGRPVAEDLPVPLPASDLVLSVGELLARGRNPGDAAVRLRRRARRRIGTRLGLGPDPDDDVLLPTLTGLGIDAGFASYALQAPVYDEPTLVALAHDLDQLTEMLHGTPAR